MNISVGNLNGGNASISSMISQLVAQRTSSLNTLLEQRSSIENSLAALQYSGLGSINNSYSSQISSLQDTLDRLRNQYTINENKLNTINTLNNSYKKTVTTLDDYINSLKNPTSTGVEISGTSSNNTVAGVTVTGPANPQKIDLTVTQLATCSTLTSAKISGTSVTGSTKITDLFAGTYSSATNTITSTRTDLTESMKLSEIGITEGAFKLGSRVIRVSADETLGTVIAKINADSNYTAQINPTTGVFSIKANTGSSVAITNAVGDLNINGELTTTTKLSDIGVKTGTYFVGDSQVDITTNDTIGTLIDKIEANGYNASLQTDISNPSAKVLSITDGSGNTVSTEASNFASLAGFTVSEGDFKINGTTFNIDSNTTIDDLLHEINRVTSDGVGAQLKSGKIILTASETGAIDINVEKGSSNFTNVIGFTQGGMMNTTNYIVGSDGAYATLKGSSSAVSFSDIAKSDGTGDFKTGTFIISYSKLNSIGEATGEMLSTIINVDDGDTVSDIAQKIRTQTAQSYTGTDGLATTNYLEAEIVDGHFQIRQTLKGASYQISVTEGTSDFTSYVGMTQSATQGTSIAGSSTKFTGTKAVTSATTFTAGSFTITASLANDPTTTQTVTIDVTGGETLSSVISKINSAGLAVTASLVDYGDDTQRLQLAHNNYGAGYTISVAAGSTNFTEKVGFTATVSSGVSTTSTYSTLTGSETDRLGSDGGFSNGSFVIRTNKLSEDGKTASSEMASAVIEVTTTMNIDDIMAQINSATYTDEHGNTVDLGLRASLTADGRVQIRQIYSGEGFDIEIEAGDSTFTNNVGLTNSTGSTTIVHGGTSSYVIAGSAYNGTFTEGSFVVTTNRANPDGTASSEMISKEITIESGKTLEEQIDSINSQLAEIGLTAEIIDGKLKISQTNAGEGYDIIIESGSSDFTQKLGLTTSVSNTTSTDETSAYLQGTVNWADINFSAITNGEFTVSTNAVDSDGNATSEIISKTVTISVSLTADEQLASLNSQLSSIGLSASIAGGKLTIRQNNSGEGFTIKVNAGTTNFTEMAGLTSTVSVGVSTEATSTSVRSTSVVLSEVADPSGFFTAGTFNINVGYADGTSVSHTVIIEDGDSVDDIIQKVNNADLCITASFSVGIDAIIFEHNNAGDGYTISFEAGSSNFTEYAGLTTTVMSGTSSVAEVTTLTGQMSGLTNETTFTEGQFIITTTALTTGAQSGYYAGTSEYSITIDVAEGEALASVLNKINTQGEAIGISAKLTADGKVEISQLNNGSGFDISVVAGDTDFTSKVGLTTAVTVGISTDGVQTSLTGVNTLDNKYLHRYNTIKGLDLTKTAGVDFADSGRVKLVLMDGNSSAWTAEVAYTSGESSETIINRVIDTLNSSGMGTASIFITNSISDGLNFVSEEGYSLLIDDISGNFAQDVGLTKVKKTSAEIVAIDGSYSLVGTATQLLAALNSDPNCKIILMRDIDFTGITINAPLYDRFCGTLDGNGYSLTNLAIGDDTTLFNVIEGGTIRNLGIKNVTYTSGSSVGLLAHALNYAYVDNVTIDNVQIDSTHSANFGLIANDMMVSKISYITISNSSVVTTQSNGTVSNGLLVGTAVAGSSKRNIIDAFNIYHVTFNSEKQASTCTGLLVGNSVDTDIKNGHIYFATTDVNLSLLGIAANSTIQNIAIYDSTATNAINIVVKENFGCEISNIYNNSRNVGSYLSLVDNLQLNKILHRTGLTTWSLTPSLNTQNTTIAFGDFEAGAFTITAGEEGNEITTTINVYENDLVNDVISRINSAGLGITASLNDEDKLILTANTSGPNFNISVESGTSDFLARAGLASEVEQTAYSTNDSYSTLLSDEFQLTYTTGLHRDIISGTFKINGVTIDFGGFGTSLTSIADKINEYSAQTGVTATLVNNRTDASGTYASLQLKANTTGEQTIYVEEGSSGLGAITGLTSASVGGGVALGTEGTKTAIVGSHTVKTQFMTESEAIAAGYSIVKTADDLLTLNGSNGKFILMNNIDLSSNSVFSISSFSGTLDGNGFTISNSSSGTGLFRELSGTVKNLTLDNFIASPPGELAMTTPSGILANTAYDAVVNNVTILNSSVSAHTNNDLANSVGALFGEYQASISYASTPQISDVVIKNTTVSGDTYVGGLIGSASGTMLNMSKLWVDTILETDALYGDQLTVGGVVGNYTVDYSLLADSYVNTSGDFSSFTASSIGAIYGYSNVIDTGDINNIYIDSSIGATQFFGSSGEYNNVLHGSVYHNIENFNEVDSYLYYVTTKEIQHLAQQYLVSLPNGVTQISAGTVNINGTTVTFDRDCSINDAIDKINSYSSTTGVTASIVDGKVTLVSNSSFSVTEGTSDFVEKTGVAGYTIAHGDAVYETQTVTIVNPLMMTADIAKNEGYTCIRTADEFLTKLSEDPSGAYVLMNDIDFSTVDINDYGLIEDFSGILEGNGFSIKNYISEDGYSLIDSTSSNAIIRNLTLDGFSLGSDTCSANTSLLIGNIYGATTIDNVIVKNSCIKSSGDVACLVNYVSTNEIVLLKNVELDKTVSLAAVGSGYVAGLINKVERAGSLIIKNITTEAILSANDVVSGLISWNAAEHTYLKNARVGGFFDTEFFASGLICYQSGILSIEDTYFYSESNEYICYVDTTTTTNSKQSKISAQNFYYVESDVTYDVGFGISTSSLANADTELGKITGSSNNAGAYRVNLSQSKATALGYTVIKTAAEFQSLINANLDGKFILMNDIDLSGVSWTPIQNFTGTLDGNGYTIKNLTYSNTSTSTKYKGLFGLVDGAEFRNLTLDNMNVTVQTSTSGGYAHAGILAAYAKNGVVVENVTVTNSSVKGTYAGGLIGALAGTGGSSFIFDNVNIAANVSVTGASAVGMIQSFTAHDVNDFLVVTNSKSLATVTSTGNFYTAQIIGGASGSTYVNNVYTAGTVKGGSYLGGICGKSFDGYNLNVFNTVVATESLEATGGAISGEGVLTACGNNYVLGTTFGYMDAHGVCSWTSCSNSFRNKFVNKVGRDVINKAFSGDIRGYGETKSSYFITSVVKHNELASVADLINSRSTSGSVSALYKDGVLQIFGVSELSGSLTSSITASEQYTRSSVSGLDYDMQISGLTSGELYLKDDKSITIESTDTIGDIQTKLQAQGIASYLLSDGRFLIKSTVSATSTTNFEDLLGLQTSGTVKVSDNSKSTQFETLTGSVGVNGYETLNAGTFQFGVGDNYTNITINHGETINSVLKKINESGYVTAAIENGKVVLTSVNNDAYQCITAKDISGNFGEITGLSTSFNNQCVSTVGSEGTCTTVTGSKKVNAGMSIDEAIAAGYTIVRTEDDLRAMDGSSGKFFLANDIVLSTNCDDVINVFAGTFDGNGHEISCGYLVEVGSLFGDLRGTAKITNLKLNLNDQLYTEGIYDGILADCAWGTNIELSNIEIIGGAAYADTSNSSSSAGALIGYADISDTLTIDNIKVQGAYIADSHYKGILVGTVANAASIDISNIIIEESELYSNDTEPTAAGGLIGLVIDNGITAPISINNVYTDIAGSDFAVLLGKSQGGSVVTANKIYVDGSNRLDSSNIYFVDPSFYTDIYDDIHCTNNIELIYAVSTVIYSSGFSPTSYRGFYQDSRSQVTAGTVKINGVDITLSGGNLQNAISQINEKSSETGVMAYYEKGRLVLKNTEAGSHSISVIEGTSNFVQLTGISGYSLNGVATEYTTTTYEGQDSGHPSMYLATGGTIIINGVNISLLYGDTSRQATREELVVEINAKSSETGVTALYNDAWSCYVFYAEPGKGISIEKGTSNIYNQIVSSTDDSINIPPTKFIKSSISGLTKETTLGDLTGNDFVDGTMVTGLAYSSSTTLTTILAAAGGGYLDEQGRVCLRSTDNLSDELRNILGFNSYVVGNSAKIELGSQAIASTITGTTTVTADTVVSTGDFYINYGNNTSKITITEGMSVADVCETINNLYSNLNAEIVNSKLIVQESNTCSSNRISFNDGTSNFCELTGLTTGGEQIKDTVLGYNAKLTSQNTALSAQGLYSNGTFVVATTVIGDTQSDSATITIDDSDSISDIVEKINNCGIDVNAYIDANTGKLVIEHNDASTPAIITVQKGTSDFTNIIGFTSGGEQNVETVQGTTAELVSQNTVTNAVFTSGTFEIQMTDVNGNVTTTRTFTVNAGDTAAKIAQDITNAGLGLTAYIDNTTDKMVIKKNIDAGEGGFIVDKGTSNFTTVMGFSSGGHETGTLDLGTSATLTSLNSTDSVSSFTSGNFYVNGTEINISSTDSIQTVLDRITTSTNVIATLDANNKIVLTLKAHAGEEDIVVTKGTSDFTNKFGFTSGGTNTATMVEGTNAVIKSNATSLDTAVSAGDFYIQLTGENATAPIKITVGQNATVATVMDQINALEGIMAYFDSSAGKLVVQRDDETGDGNIQFTPGSSNFTTLLGLTAGGHQAATFVQGTEAVASSSSGLTFSDSDITEGDFNINVTKEDGTVVQNTIEVEDGDTIADIVDKINAIDGVSATWDEATQSFNIELDGNSDASSFEVVKGSSNFTNLAGLTSGGQATTTVVEGSFNSVSSSTPVDSNQTFTEGDFVITMGTTDITIDVEEGDTVQDIVDKINAVEGLVASYDEDTGLISISHDGTYAGKHININKGSSNFTNVVGFTSGGTDAGIATFIDGETAELVSTIAAGDTQNFGTGNFMIKLTGDVATGLDSEFTIDVTSSDTIYTIAQKITDADNGVTAYVNAEKKLVLTRDADSGIGGIEVIKGTSTFTNDIGLTTGGEELSNLSTQGSSTKLVSNLDYASVAGAYTSGDFFIQLYDYMGNTTDMITVNIATNNGVVDDIYAIMNSLNSQNAGVTAKLENGKLVLTMDENSSNATFSVIKGTSDFTTKIGLTSGGGMGNGVLINGKSASVSVLSSQDLGDKIVSDSMTLGSIGVTAGTFEINGVDINVKTSDTIYDLTSRINTIFSSPEYSDISVSASYENGELVLRTNGGSSTLLVEKGTSNFTDIAKLTNSYQNSTDLGITAQGHNAQFNINGTDYDMALSLNEDGENMLYLDSDGNVVSSEADSSIAINIKKEGNTVIEIGRQVLDDSVKKLQTFINRFNSSMIAATNPILSDDTQFISFVNKIKSALTSDVGDFKKITTQLAELGIVIKVTGGTDSNMGIVEMKLTKTNGEYDYVNEFYKNPGKVYGLLIGDDSTPFDNTVAGAFSRLSNVLHNTLESNRSGYFNVTPRSIEAQQKALKNEISSVAFDLNELKLAASGSSVDSALTDHLSELEKQYQLVNDAIANLNKQYSAAISRLILNQNNASFNPIV